MTNDDDTTQVAANAAEADRQRAKEIRSYTNRMRKAVRQLPADINYMNSYGGRPLLVKEDLQEIIGAATAIADLLGMEL